MRTLPTGLFGHFQGGATTLCHAWKLVRRDGAAFGFTDHDRDLAFGGVVFAARTGLDAAEATQNLGFAVGGGEVSGALVSAGLTEDDLAAGLYDDAGVETWLVNWASPDERLLLDVQTIGEIRRADDAFIAELRGLMHRLDEERGRLYRATCAADLGDACCGIDLASPAYTGSGEVLRSDGALDLEAAGLSACADGWFTGGKLVWTRGANQALAAEVKAHRLGDGIAGLELWQRAPRPIAPGDAFRVSAGCSKRFDACRQKFGNVLNFRGFPHLPGNDFVVRVPREGEPGLDGGSFFR